MSNTITAPLNNFPRLERNTQICTEIDDEV